MAESAQGVTVTIELGEDELLGAHLLAKVDGVASRDGAGFDRVLRSSLRHGVADRLAAAGIAWPPTVRWPRGPAGGGASFVRQRSALGTPVMDAQPLAALDLPLKLLVWDDHGHTRLSYLTPAVLSARHALPESLAAPLAEIDQLTDAALTGAGKPPD